MIRLTFKYQTQIMTFEVIGKEIWYQDKLGRLRCIPRDEAFIKKILESRNKLPRQLITMFELSKKDKAEYDSCKTEEDYAEKILFDCKSKGLILLKEEKGVV